VTGEDHGRPEVVPDALEIARGRHLVVRVAPRPFNSGSVVLDLGRPVTSFAELSIDELEEVAEWVGRVESAMGELYHPEGMNVGFVIGEGVREPSLGIQLVPRWTGDVNFMPVIASTKVLPETLAETARRYRECLGGPGAREA
jgi:ATP adenylyltransferase